MCPLVDKLHVHPTCGTADDRGNEYIVACERDTRILFTGRRVGKSRSLVVIVALKSNPPSPDIRAAASVETVGQDVAATAAWWRVGGMASGIQQ